MQEIKEKRNKKYKIDIVGLLGVLTSIFVLNISPVLALYSLLFGFLIIVLRYFLSKNKNLKDSWFLKKRYLVLIIILIPVITVGVFFVKKVLFYKKSIEYGSIIIENDVGKFSSYNGSVNTGQSTVKREEIESKDDPSKGAENPIMTIVEFSDFNCLHCLSAYRDVKLFVEENKDKVKFIYRDFPISEDITASVAANCAHEQGKFWQMHDKIFENQRILDEKILYKLAKEIGLNSDDFDTCYKSKKYDSEIYNDANLAINAGVSGTPTFFINGEKFQGVIPLQIWNQILEALKKESSNP